jgi:riboflavin kinase
LYLLLKGQLVVLLLLVLRAPAAAAAPDALWQNVAFILSLIMANILSPQDYKDLATFLCHDNSAVQSEAIKVISANVYNNKDNSIDSSLLPYYQQFLPSLSLLISHHNLYLQTNSLKLLISLSENDELLQSLLEANIINRIMELLIDKEDRNHKLEIILLANLSRSDIGSSLLMQENSLTEGLFIRRLINWFINDLTSEDYDYIANILMNVSTRSSGRKLLVNKEKGFIREFLKQLQLIHDTMNKLSHLSVELSSFTQQTRKFGLINVLRNLFMEHLNHAYLLHEEYKLLDILLQFIAGEGELREDETEILINTLPLTLAHMNSSHLRDSSLQIRRLICEIIYLTAKNQPSRLILKQLKVYPIIRELHKYEQALENKELDEFIYDIVPYLVLDEGDEKNVNNDRKEAEQENKAAASPPPKLDLSDSAENQLFDAQLNLSALADNRVYRLKGLVVKGFGRGSKLLGCPTANLEPKAFLEELKGIPRGVYAGFAQINNGAVYKCVLSLGTNPTFNTVEDTVEAFILHDYTCDFYGSIMKLIIVAYLRPSAKFDSLEELMKWIARDTRVATKQLDQFKQYQQDQSFHNNNSITNDGNNAEDDLPPLLDEMS